MTCKKNKRTLKKRIRTVVSLCILFTVLFFGGLILYLASFTLKAPAEYITSYVSTSIASNMNSIYFLRQQEIKGLEDFNPDTPKSKDWLESLKYFQTPSDFMKELDNKVHKLENGQKKADSVLSGIKKQDAPGMEINIFNTPYIGSLEIELNSKTIFSVTNLGDGFLPLRKDANGTPVNPNPEKDFIGHLLDYFSDIKSSSPLFDSKGNEIGNVTVKVNPHYLLVIYMMIAFTVFFIGLLSLIIANIISRFLTIPTITPLHHLEKTFSQIASEDFNSSEIKQIVLKRPLREIESLVNSTNMIMQKLKEYNKILADQKILVENQNEELEAQNEELIESKRQIEEAQTLFVQSENMASIGQLTAAITHEINTPLGAINSNVQLCDMMMNTLLENKTVQSDDELLEVLTQIREANNINVFACQRVTEIIKSLKTFSKLDQAEFQEADIIESIKSVLVLTSNLWKKKITIHQEFEPLPMVKCFPGLLNQVFMNIIVNGIQSIEDKGDLYIKTYLDEKFVNVSIKDTGCGIKEENLARIFESGFSTKGAGIGMGLGLSICQNIIKKHHGDIQVISELNKGSEFIVRIPLNND